MSAGIPLARLQLMHEKRRLMAAVAGIIFAVVLMLVQLGFEDALLSSTRQLPRSLRADLVLIHPQYQFLISTKSFSEGRLYQALSLPEVESATPLYVGQASFKNPETHTERVIFLVGFEPSSVPLDLPYLDGQLALLRQPEAAVFDRLCRPEFGPVEKMWDSHQRLSTEVGGHKVDIAGFFNLGTSFAIDGTLAMSDENFFRVLPYRQRGLADLGLIKLKPGADAVQVQTRLAALLPNDVRVLTHQQYVDLELGYWTSNTPIGFIFTLGVAMGIVVGLIIVYQILYNDVNSHLPEYATLKAMGYPNSYMSQVVLRQALLLSIIGFLPGGALSVVIYKFAGEATLLPVHMTIGRMAAVYLLTALMCVGAGALAMRRVRLADPAEIF